MGTVEEKWKQLGKLIERRRLSLLMSQVDMADQGKLGRSTVQKLEQGTARPKEDTRRKVERVLQWAEGDFDRALAGGTPVGLTGPADAQSPRDGGQDAWAELAERLPASFVHELATGKVFATDVQDLTLDGGLRLFTVVIRNPDQEPRSPQQVKAETEAWYRTQRELRQKPPVDTSADPGESGVE